MKWDARRNGLDTTKRRTERLKRVTTETSLFLSDLHIPYHCAPAVRGAVELAGYMKPHEIFLNGDVIDFYGVSRFEKDPARKFKLQDDINETKVFLGELRSAAPNARITYIPGNHEDRLRRYLLSQAEELATLDDLQFDRLLRLADYDVSLVPRNVPVRYHDIVITHGDRVRSRAGYSAHAMLDKFGTSGISGHTHRAAKVSRTFLTGRRSWVESGCLCDLNPDYVDGCADWQQSIVVGSTLEGHTELDLLSWTNGSFYYDRHAFGDDEGG